MAEDTAGRTAGEYADERVARVADDPQARLALLRDTCEASALAFGRAGAPRTPGVEATLDFIRDPPPRAWHWAGWRRSAGCSATRGWA